GHELSGDTEIQGPPLNCTPDNALEKTTTENRHLVECRRLARCCDRAPETPAGNRRRPGHGSRWNETCTGRPRSRAPARPDAVGAGETSVASFARFLGRRGRDAPPRRRLRVVQLLNVDDFPAVPGEERPQQRRITLLRNRPHRTIADCRQKDIGIVPP